MGILKSSPTWLKKLKIVSVSLILQWQEPCCVNKKYQFRNTCSKNGTCTKHIFPPPLGDIWYVYNTVKITNTVFIFKGESTVSLKTQSWKFKYNDGSVEITNKMQPCNRIYYSNVYWT